MRFNRLRYSNTVSCRYNLHLLILSGLLQSTEILEHSHCEMDVNFLVNNDSDNAFRVLYLGVRGRRVSRQDVVLLVAKRMHRKIYSTE